MDADPDLATKPTLHGTLATLRPSREGDAEVMAQVLSDPEVRRLTGSVESTAQASLPEPLDDPLRDWYATRNEQTDRLDLAVEGAVTGVRPGALVFDGVAVGAVDMAVEATGWAGFPRPGADAAGADPAGGDAAGDDPAGG